MRLPMCLMVDDPMPLLNPLYYVEQQIRLAERLGIDREQLLAARLEGTAELRHERPRGRPAQDPGRALHLQRQRREGACAV